MLFRIVLLALLLAAIGGCSATKRVPQGSHLLTKNIVEEDKQTKKQDRVGSGKVERFIKPKPNRKFLGTNFYIALYNMASPDTTKQGWFNRKFRSWGEAPVLLDTTLVEQSAEFIENYIRYAGFYDAEVEYQIDTTRRKKRARVTYLLEQKTPYRIGEIKYEFRDKSLRQIIFQDSAKTLLHSGRVLDGNVLGEEKERVTAYLKNRGFYNFNLNSIEFLGDSTVGNHVVDLTIVFKQHLAGYTPEGQAIYENNSIYRLSRIVVNPDYDPMRAAIDPDYYLAMDTIEFRGLNVMVPSGSRPKVRNKILRRTINLYPNELYSSSEVQSAYNNIMRLGYYKNASIIFDNIEAPDTSAATEVTYVGGPSGDADQYSPQAATTERYMSCHINGIAGLKQSYKIELEGATSSNFHSITATIGYQNRNLFRGVELFDVSVRGGYEFVRTKGRKGSFEIGGAVSMSFPRFVSPINLDPRGKKGNARTKVEMSINAQRRPYYHRTLSSLTWMYSWNNKRRSSYTVRPIDLNLVKMGYLDQAWMDGLKSEYLKNSYRSQLIPGISFQYLYNKQLESGESRFMKESSLLIRVNAETAGNLFYGISNLFAAKHTIDDNGDRYYDLFGIRYAQYFRVDASISNKIYLGGRVNIAYRFYSGFGFSYGNARSIPFDRLFYSGGSSSMRGWIPRTLGPGNTKPEGDSRYPNQLGNIKLEANAELRFPMVGILNGALFFDVGNVWFLREGASDYEAGTFKINRFYRQLGFNTGLGFRIDIGMAVLRLDWGMRVHDPNLDKGKRWIKSFRFSNTVLNFGVGYPF